MNIRLILFLLLGLSFGTQTFAQNRAVGKFFRTYKHTEDAVHFTLPGFLTWAGTGLARGFVDSDEEKLFLKLAQKLGTTKLLVLEDQPERANSAVPIMLADLQTRHGYEPMIEVRRGGEENITVMFKGNEKKIKRLFILVQTGDELVLLSARTRLNMKKLKKIIERLMEEDNFQPRKEAEKLVIPVA